MYFFRFSSKVYLAYRIITITGFVLWLGRVLWYDILTPLGFFDEEPGLNWNWDYIFVPLILPVAVYILVSFVGTSLQPAKRIRGMVIEKYDAPLPKTVHRYSFPATGDRHDSRGSAHHLAVDIQNLQTGKIKLYHCDS